MVKRKKAISNYYLKEERFIKKKMEISLSGAAARTGNLRKNEKRNTIKNKGKEMSKNTLTTTEA